MINGEKAVYYDKTKLGSARL